MNSNFQLNTKHHVQHMEKTCRAKHVASGPGRGMNGGRGSCEE